MLFGPPDAAVTLQNLDGRPDTGTVAHGVVSEGGHPPSDMQQALLPKAASSKYQHPIGPWRRRYTVLLVAVIAALLSADQNLLAPNTGCTSFLLPHGVTAVKLSVAAAYFNLDDSQKDTYLGGYLMAAFFLVGAPAALLCGYFADKFNRIHMLAFIVVVGEAPCLGTYWVTELWQFFLVRMLTGISIGGCFPLVFSLLGDLFPVSQRAAMSAIVQIAIGGGIGGGQMLAGLLGPATNWRLPFVVMATPTLLLAVLLLTTVREPPRGGFEKALEGQLAAGATYSESITWAKVWRLLRVPSNWIIILQGIPGCLPWGVMQTYINDYLHLNKGLSVELATTITLLFGIGCAVGVIAGGAAGQALYNWRRETMAVLTGVSVLAGAAPVLFLINADIQATGLGAALVMSALAGFLVSIAGPNLRAIMINVNTPETRGVALALQSVTDDLGKGLGPVIVAGFISHLGRTGAFNLSVSAWFPCGLLLTSLACTMRRDEDTMQERLAEQSARTLTRIQVEPAADRSSHGDGPGAAAGPTPQAGLEPGSPSTGAGSGFAGRLHVPSALQRTFGCGAKVMDEASGEGENKGLRQVLGQGCAAAALAAVYANGSSRVVVPVLAEAGSLEMQQLLLHHQQEYEQSHGSPCALKDVRQQSGSNEVAPAPAGQQPQQQHEQQQSVGQPLLQNENSSGSSSRGCAAHLQHPVSPDCQAALPAASISAAGTRYRAGHGPKQRGSHGSGSSGGYGSGSSGDSSSGSTSIALGEGVEHIIMMQGWQAIEALGVRGKQGVVA